MPIVYPMQQIGPFGLGFGFTYKFIHDQYGFDLGERYHRDVNYRVKTTMDIDRAIYYDFGDIGLGYADPCPRISIEPFGHRFMPAMYGCEIHYAPDQEPACLAKSLPCDVIDNLEPWTLHRVEQSEPVRVILSQFEEVKREYSRYRIPDDQFNPHYRTMSTLQNLGSVINTAFSILGDELFINAMDHPSRVHQFYRNITELMLCCLDYFPRCDGWPLKHVFIGNCVVSMISPEQYTELNLPYDRMIMEYAQTNGADFMLHQDSNINPNLENYTQLSYVHTLDIGQDTDFEKVVSLFPAATVNCILFPSWLIGESTQAIQNELNRLMHIGRRFKTFSFTLLEIDQHLGHRDLLLEFYGTFKKCAQSCQ